MVCMYNWICGLEQRKEAHERLNDQIVVICALAVMCLVRGTASLPLAEMFVHTAR